MGILVPLFAGLFVTIIMSLIAYFLEFYRGMYIALLFGLSIFIDMSFDLPIAMLVGAVLVAIPGLILFIRFIKQYPIQTGSRWNMTVPKQADRFATIADLDKLIHEPARMSIMAVLYVLESADFTFLMNQTGLTWGNLSAHLTKLETAGYVEVVKSFKGKRPNTNLKLSSTGREAFRKYMDQMKQVVNDFPK